MKISINWLKDYITLDETPAMLSEDLSSLGLPVETVENVGNDCVLDIDLTANRPDCLNHVGVARELSAFYRIPLRRPKADLPEAPEKPLVPVSIEIQAPDLCARYCGLVIRGVRVAPSPSWLRERLEALGQRSINNVVDITNYVLLELGHPLHAFDYNLLENGRVVIRRAAQEETLTTLDGQARTLDTDMLVIADGRKPIALAGVMGGENTEVGDSTTDLFLESAWFAPSSIRRTARAVGLSTDASYRFERGADVEILPLALCRAARLILALAGGEVASPMIEAYPAPRPPEAIRLRRDRASMLIGLSIGTEFVEDLLPRLGFVLKRDGETGWMVVPPSFRQDMSLEVDLIEELARFSGYDRIPASLPNMMGNPVPLRDADRREAARQCLKENGFQEILTMPFCRDEEDESLVSFRPGERIRLDNPLDDGEPFLRMTLMTGLLRALKFNENNFNRDVRLFEVARVYGLSERGPREKTLLTFGAFGDTVPASWLGAGTPWGFFHLKAQVEAVLLSLGLTGWEVVPGDDVPFLQNGQAARLRLRGKEAGVFGALDPKLAGEWKFRSRPFVAELDLDVLFGVEPAAFGFQPPFRFPAVDRDISLAVDKDTPYSTIASVIKDMKIPELVRVEVRDLYMGKGVPEGRKAVTIRLVFQDPERTLTDTEIDAVRARVADVMTRRLKAVLR